jgi:hypothetical protein
MATSIGAGLVFGIAIAVCGERLLSLVAALWLRRPRVVAVAALLGLATADAILGVIGVWVGEWIGAVVPDGGLRSTIAIGLLVGVAARLAVGMMIGAHGVPGNAVLPTRPVGAWARFAAVGLLTPIPAMVVAANVVARPHVATDGAGAGLVAGSVAGALLIRWLWGTAAERRRGVRSARTMKTGLGLAAMLLLAFLAIRILGR